MAGNGQIQGYQWLHLCVMKQGYVVLQVTIRQLNKLIDMEGVECRQEIYLSQTLIFFHTF